MKPARKLKPAAPVLCSFCDHDERQVATMITGKPGIAICDDCVAVCVHTIIDNQRRRRGLPVNSGGKG